MNKEQRAHEYLKTMLGSNQHFNARSIKDLAELAWTFADEMEKQAEKRKVKGVPEVIVKAHKNRPVPPDVVTPAIRIY